ncbi:fimbrial biogenesis chaperone [Pseudomonas putida]|uniref:Molecular chaperone n=1 Tax=Pseudomonas putida TaxID=303 RepID=A0A6I6XE74_PSEPU|nr:molecular chaperone [Pseudomonas putida]QHG63932.1 molecular chaperone [Pseudomonas putida]
MPISIRHLLLATALASALLPPAQAALTISATRIVQTSDKQSSSIIVANPSNQAFAAQTWVNTEADDSTTSVPLIAAPELFRLDPGNKQTVQINRISKDLPNDRESLFYFNVQELPQADEEQANTLSIALRTRIKLFYRPAELQGSPQKSLKDLQWSVQRREGKAQLIVHNPSPYHYTFSRVQLGSASKRESIEAQAMVAPKSSQAYDVHDSVIKPGMRVIFTTINDFGGTTKEVTAAVSGT